MINQTMLDYVTAERIRGVMDADIQKALLAQGWPEEAVHSAIAPESTPALGSRVVPAYSSAYASSLFQGRIGRWHYLFSSIIYSLISLVAAILLTIGVIAIMGLARQVLGEAMVVWGIVIGLILAMFAIIPVMLWGFALSVRRLHDLGQSGWWILLSFIPYASIGLSIYLVFFRGQSAPNRFGPIEPYERSFHGAWDALLRK